MAIAIFILYFILAVLVLAFFLLLAIVLSHAGQRRGGKLARFVIRTQKASFDIEDTLSGLFQELSFLHIPFSLEITKPALGEQLQITLSARGMAQESLRQILENHLPQNHLEEDHHDHLLWLDGAESLSLNTLRAKRSDLIPFHWKGSFLSALSNLNALGEGAQLQILFEQADSELVNRWKLFVDDLRNHEFDVTPHLDQNFELHPENITVLEERLSQPLYRVNVHTLVSATNEDRLDTIRKKIFSFIQTERPQRNSLTVSTRGEYELEDFLMRKFDPEHSFHLSSSEIARFMLPEEEKHYPKLY
ncbi:MAG: hypothetical protein Q8P45_01530 [Candidatus Harrisonbacteria bacterium]|nr:hypothetical protein [Candidatus Harrisonbacteria bacterium]